MFGRNDRRLRFGWGFLSLASVVLAPAQSFAAPRVPTHVACVGDSITYGYGASNQSTKSYPATLQTLFGSSVQVKNFGRNAATMLSAPYGDLPYEDQPEYSAATSFVSGAGANAVVDVIIMLGTNDSKNFNWAPSGKPKNDQQFLTDYRAMVEHFGALPSKPQIFLALPLSTGNNACCSIDGAVIKNEVLPLVKQLAAEKKLPTIDLNTPTTGHPEYFSDGVHPTDAAYALVAKWMQDGLLVDLGAVGSGGASGFGGGASSGGSIGFGGSGGNTPNSSSAGTAGLASGGTTGDPAAGGGSSNAGASPSVGGTSAGGAPSTAGTSSSAAGAMSAAGSKASSAPADSGGCALSNSRLGARSPAIFGLLGLGWLAIRRRCARR
jgi:lysophospholipase L1-like esterase